MEPVNKRIWDCTFLGRSLMYSRNKIGPRPQPCGTPEDTGTSSEHSPSNCLASSSQDKLDPMQSCLVCRTSAVCIEASDG